MFFRHLDLNLQPPINQHHSIIAHIATETDCHIILGT